MPGKPLPELHILVLMLTASYGPMSTEMRVTSTFGLLIHIDRISPTTLRWIVTTSRLLQPGRPLL
jgi:hypothetical protein